MDAKVAMFKDETVSAVWLPSAGRICGTRRKSDCLALKATGPTIS